VVSQKRYKLPPRLNNICRQALQEL